MDAYDEVRRPAIDLNADLGEIPGPGDLAMLDVVTSANIACGFHAGDPASIRRTVQAAAERGIAIGAHVAYPDAEGFGRRDMDIAPDELTAGIIYQIGALDGLCRAAGTRVRYVKPHGALYNRIVNDEQQADAVVAAVAAFEAHRDLPVMGLPGSVVLRKAAQVGLPTVTEAFVDRAYTGLATLVPRGEPGAVLADVQTVAARALRMVRDGMADAITGELVAIEAKSLCVHGDSPGAVAMARAVRRALEQAGVELRPFWSGAD